MRNFTSKISLNFCSKKFQGSIKKERNSRKEIQYAKLIFS